MNPAQAAVHDDAVTWLRNYHGSIDSTALILAFKAGHASHPTPAEVTDRLGFTWDEPFNDGHIRILDGPPTNGVHMAGLHETALIAEIERLRTELATALADARDDDPSDEDERLSRHSLYADAVSLAAERSPFGHPLPEAEVRAASTPAYAAVATLGEELVRD